MRPSLLILPLLLIISAPSFSEESALKSNLTNATVVESNGTIIVSNGKANVLNENQPVLNIDTSESSGIRRVIVRNINVSSKNTNISNTGEEQAAIIQINTPGSTNSYLEHIRINSINSNITNQTNGDSSCASAFCYKSDDANGHVGNINVNAYGYNRFESTID